MKNLYARYSVEYRIDDQKIFDKFFWDEELQEDFRSKLEDGLNLSEDFTRGWFGVDYDDMWWGYGEGGFFSLDISMSPNLDLQEWSDVLETISLLNGKKYSQNLRDEILGLLPQDGFVWDTILWKASVDGGYTDCPVSGARYLRDKQILVDVRFSDDNGRDWILGDAIKTSGDLFRELSCE